jgi:hypothetical protein
MTENIVRDLFVLLADLRRDIAVLGRAFDEGRLSEADQHQLRFACDLINSEQPGLKDLATAMAIIGSIKGHY